MNVILRKAEAADIPFLREMLYEAVFWRARANKPSLAAGLADPEVSKSLAGWGARAGDTAVVAAVEAVQVGAACYRCRTADNFINGYIDQNTPVLVIAVHRDYRRRGIGRKMIAWLIDIAAQQGVSKISLSVAKDNIALKLYRQQGFVEYADRGDALLMQRKT